RSGELPLRSVGPEPAMITATGTLAVPPGTVSVPKTVPVAVVSCTLEDAAVATAGVWAGAAPADVDPAAPVAIARAATARLTVRAVIGSMYNDGGWMVQGSRVQGSRSGSGVQGFGSGFSGPGGLASLRAGSGKREAGSGKREAGSGNREAGRGPRPPWCYIHAHVVNRQSRP